jgi:adenine-specific DNA-methyltransferase
MEAILMGVRMLADSPLFPPPASRSAPARIPAPGATPDPASFAVIETADNRDFLPRLAFGTVQLIVTSPPYNIGKAYEKRKGLSRYLAEQEQTIGLCFNLLRDSGSICWQVGNHITPEGEVVPLDALLYPVFKKHGLRLRNRIVWHFEHGLHCKKRFSGRHETILWFTKSEDYTFNLDAVRVPAKYPFKKYFKGPRRGQFSCNPLGKNPGDVWVIPNVKANHCEKTEHPCQFPVELVERLVLALTNAGDCVLDPYMGVGSSIIAAVKNRRRGFGCDLVREYVETARARLEQLGTGTLKLRPIDRPIYDPSMPSGGQR